MSMRSINIIAHAGETHGSELDGIAHFIAPWYLALPAFFLALSLVGYLTWIVSGRQSDKVLVVLALVCLISGFTLFNISAIVSVVAIVGGLAISVSLTLSGLINESKK